MGEYKHKNGLMRFWNTLTKEQKLSVGVLCVCGLVAIALGYVQLRRNVISPFTTDVNQLVEIQHLFGPSEEELEREAKRTDSDGDGISDWNEENVYHTSAYIRDTDSDGEPDNIEIAKGTDPNCPKGERCAAPLETSGSASGDSSDEPRTDYGNVGSVLPLVPDRDPDAIRAFLAAQGVSEAELANYSDALLLEAYDQSAGSFAEQSSSTSNNGYQEAQFSETE